MAVCFTSSSPFFFPLPHLRQWVWVLLKLGWLHPMLCQRLAAAWVAAPNQDKAEERNIRSGSAQSQSSIHKATEAGEKGVHFLGNIPNFLKILIQSQMKPLESPFL